MMRVAAIYDIHGNLTALEAVLQEIEQAKVDKIVVGGDVIPGPLPYETLQRLQAVNIPIEYIQGNGETEVIKHKAGTESEAVPERFREIVRWTAQQLPPEYAQWLSTWPMTVTIEVQGLGKVLFCHATPRNNTEIFTRLTPEDRLLPVFDGVAASVVVCGHTHMQFDRKIANIRVVNAGSVGMPYGEPGAYWLLLGSDIQCRHTLYDVKKAAERIRGSGYPQAENFAANNVLHTPPEDEALETFTPMELK
jgi:putative phosphoesterase